MRLSMTLCVLLLATLCMVVAALQTPVFPSPVSKYYFHGPSRSISSYAKIQTRHAALSYSDFTEELPSQSVIDAVESLSSRRNNGKSNKVILASDVASAAGVSLSQARKDLTKLAALTLGDIAVSNEGELLYSFPSSVRSVLSSNSLKYKVADVFRTQVWPVMFYAIRVSFGVALLASIAIIYSTIAFASASSSSSNDDNKRDDRRSFGSFGGGGFFGPSPLDFFFYRPYYGVNSYQGATNNAPEEMGLLESVFSYIFGDGNPNMDLEEKRLRLASQVIRENRGAVTAEQLAPFSDNVPIISEGDQSESFSLVDEAYVLPIVSKLGGEPIVTDDGDIIYTFPDLQLSGVLESSEDVKSALVLGRAGLRPDASAREIKREMQLAGIDVRGALDKSDLVQMLNRALPEVEDDAISVLQEKEITFSAAGALQRTLAAGLGVVNVAGALYLGNLLSSPALQGARLPGYFGLVQTAYPFLLAYAILFNVIPVVRNFWINQENQKIRERNEARRSWYSLVQSNISRTTGNIAKKLRSAQLYGSNMRMLGKGDSDIVFDTRKSISDDDAKKEETALREFDQLMSSRNSTQSEWQ